MGRCACGCEAPRPRRVPYSSSIPSAGSICSSTGWRYSTRPGTDCFAAAPAAISSSELPPRFHSRESSEVPTWIRFGSKSTPPSVRMGTLTGSSSGPRSVSMSDRSILTARIAAHSSRHSSDQVSCVAGLLVELGHSMPSAMQLVAALYGQK